MYKKDEQLNKIVKSVIEHPLRFRCLTIVFENIIGPYVFFVMYTKACAENLGGGGRGRNGLLRSPKKVTRMTLRASFGRKRNMFSFFS